MKYAVSGVHGGAGGLADAGGWGEARVDVPAGRWTDLLAGRDHDAGGDGLALADVLVDRPVALLVSGDLLGDEEEGS